MAVIEIAKIQVRRGQEHVTGVPRLDPGEFGWAEDTQNLYIGKRINEGANSDENSRILTDLDLKNILDIIGGGSTGSAASTSTYRYRDTLDYNYFHSTTTSIAKKLDTSVSLQDFSQNTISGDITQVLRTAINDIYANSHYGTDTIRTLLLPAGTFTVSGAIDIPPTVNLIGNGRGITTLVLNSAGTNLFRTVDRLGSHFEQGMQFDDRASRDVVIRDMTLAYSGNYQNNLSLISLDNTENPKLVNLEFTTISTLTNFVSSGVGVSIRGSVGVDESTVICRDIEITNCKFNMLDTAVVEDGNVSKTVIDKNEFTNLNQGIIATSTSSQMPADILISKNKFKFIYNEAVNIHDSANYSRVVSTENQYYYVGNRSSMPDQDAVSATGPVLYFGAPGNVSLNDYFNRADCPYTTNFYYNPLINANAKLINNRPYSDTVSSNTPNRPVLKISLTGQDQVVTIDYSISNIVMSRKGRLIMNISSDGYASVSDYYNYSETADNESTKVVFSTDNAQSISNNFVSLTCSNFSQYQTNLEFTYDITV
jgi:hypothetical protein